jgi:hypothetical protein
MPISNKKMVAKMAVAAAAKRARGGNQSIPKHDSQPQKEVPVAVGQSYSNEQIIKDLFPAKADK